MVDYSDLTRGWDEEAVLRHRLGMYKRFNAANPHVKKVGSLLTIIAILEVIYYLAAIIYYFTCIDDIIFKEYAAKQSNQNHKVIFDSDLSSYIKSCLKKPT